MKRFVRLVAALTLLGVFGCAGPFTRAQFVIDESFCGPDLDLDGATIGFVTPSSANGSEDKWILSDILAETLKEMKKKHVTVILPSEFLSSVNQAGITREYNEMIKDYQTCGILSRDILATIGEAMGIQYLVHVKLTSFDQFTSVRLNLLGLRAIDSQMAKIRLFLRIWQTEQGKVVWVGSGEGIITRERFRARPVSLNEVARLGCRRLVEQLP
jgi:hypothetical protein